jgi:hypothetical protein
MRLSFSVLLVILSRLHVMTHAILHKTTQLGRDS